MSNNELCAICHENLNSDKYILSECQHIFHSHCIITWFRSGQNRCPLCNNRGVNADARDVNVLYFERPALMENYKNLRRKCRSKNFPVNLKRSILKLKKMEKKAKNHLRHFKEFKEESHPDKKAKEIHSMYIKFRHKGFMLRNSIQRMKLCIGASHRQYHIIIPVRQESNDGLQEVGTLEAINI